MTRVLARGSLIQPQHSYPSVVRSFSGVEISYKIRIYSSGTPYVGVQPQAEE